MLAAYAVVAFGVLQAIEPIMHGLHWPDVVLSYVVVGLAAGFPVVVVLAWAFDVNAGRIERTPATPGAPRGVGLGLVLLGVGLLAAAPGAAWYFFLRAPVPAAAESGESLRARLDAAAPASEIRAAPSIAVLPFVNLSSDKEQEYFSDGLAEELLNLLAKVPGLHVAARTSAFSFKGKSEDVRAIGKALNVATVLEGSVRKGGEQVRITAQLINAADGFHLWSETYDRKLTDVFAVQDEIARAVVAGLKLKLLPEQTPTTKDKRTANPEVYTQYLIGNQLMTRARASRSGFQPAAQAFEKALAIDPGYAPAWAGLAFVRFWLADNAESVAAIEAGQKLAVEAAERAVALAPELAEALAARGAQRGWIQHDWAGSRADLERSLQLEPGNSETWTYYALLHAILGRLPETVAALTKATELDPLNSWSWAYLGGWLTASGRTAEARSALDRALEVDPQQANAQLFYGRLELLDEKPAPALERFERAPAGYPLMGRALCLHALGRKLEAEAALDQLIARDAHDMAFQIAEVYAFRGEKGRAFEWLERAWVQRDSGLSLIKVSIFLRGLHGDPRFTAWLVKLKLPLD